MMKRRQFIKSTAISGAALTFAPAFANAAMNVKDTVKGFPYGMLGKTGKKVSMLGIGGWQAGTDTVPLAELEKMVATAHEYGINYIDTAPNYGNSEEKLGVALEGIREDFIIATKTEEPGYDGTWRLMEESLKRLKTDYIDIINLHSLGNLKRFPDIETIVGEKGAVKALVEAKKQKLVHHIGVTGHSYPSRFHHLLNTGEMEVMMNAVNYVIQHSYDFEHKVWSRAREENLGLIAMKVLGGGDPKPKAFRLPHDSYVSAIRYAMSIPGVGTMVIGMENNDELTRAADTVKEVSVLSEDEQKALYIKGLEILQSDDVWQTPYGPPQT